MEATDGEQGLSTEALFHDKTAEGYKAFSVPQKTLYEENNKSYNALKLFSNFEAGHKIFFSVILRRWEERVMC